MKFCLCNSQHLKQTMLIIIQKSCHRRGRWNAKAGRLWPLLFVKSVYWVLPLGGLIQIQNWTSDISSSCLYILASIALPWICTDCWPYLFVTFQDCWQIFKLRKKWKTENEAKELSRSVTEMWQRHCAEAEGTRRSPFIQRQSHVVIFLSAVSFL